MRPHNSKTDSSQIEGVPSAETGKLVNKDTAVHEISVF